MMKSGQIHLPFCCMLLTALMTNLFGVFALTATWQRDQTKQSKRKSKIPSGLGCGGKQELATQLAVNG